MAGNPKTSKSVALKTPDRPSTKGVRVGVNPKAGVMSTAVNKKGSMGGKKK